MKKSKSGCAWYYVDESGDPTFYNRHGKCILGKDGCSRYLILGFAQIPNSELVRQAILAYQSEVVHDPRFQQIPSLKKTAIQLHAKDDHASIRSIIFERLAQLDFKVQFIVARKDEVVFQNQYNGDEQLYYDRLVASLFETVLHRHEQNTVVFSRRYNKDRRDPLRAAINQGVERFKERCQVTPTISMDVTAQTTQGEPCLAVVDYALWAVQRVFIRDEWHFYEMLEDKVSMLRILDNEWPRARSWYNRKYPLSMEKATPLVLGSQSERTA